MNRQEFLYTIWKQWLQPILFLGVVFYCLRFLIRIFTENGIERSITVVILLIILARVCLKLLDMLYTKAIHTVTNLIPDFIKPWIRFMNAAFIVVMPFLYLIIMIQLWKEDWVIAAVVIALNLFTEFKAIIGKNKNEHLKA